MTYRGIISNGVVVLDGEAPGEGTVVEVVPLPGSIHHATSLIDDPAIGMWKDRKDIPEDPVEASKALGERLMRRVDE